MVWFGFFTCTDADIEALKEATNNPDIGIDELSLCGRYHPDWSTASDVKREIPANRKSGGRGSIPFEAQYCGTGVSFTREPIWHFRRDGSGPFMEVPPNSGAYHKRFDGDGFTNHSGPEPGSQAAEILGRTAYHWNEEVGYYFAGPECPTPWWTE